MAYVVGLAGSSAARKSLIQALALPVVILIAVLCFTPALVMGLLKGSLLQTVGMLVVVLPILGWLSRADLLDAYSMTAGSRSWAKGAEGERKTSEALSRLVGPYLVLNDVHPALRGERATWNWDHVVIGPTGLFVLDSKNYGAKVIESAKVDARTQRDVRKVRGYALDFKKRLVELNKDLKDVFVVAVVVYVGSSRVDSLLEGDVHVVPLHRLRKDIVEYSSTRLSAPEARKIANLLFDMYDIEIQSEYRKTLKYWGEAVRNSDWDRTSKGASKPAEREVDSGAYRCPICGAPMYLFTGEKFAPHGDFYGCTRYRETDCRGRRDANGNAKGFASA